MFNLPDFVFYLIAGVVGAFAMSIGRSLGQKFIPHFPDMPLMLGRMIDWGKPEPEKKARIMGRYLHLGVGAFLGLFFGLLVERQFFFVEFTIVSGILFSIIPWLMLMMVLLPMMKKGFFGTKINSYQWLTALALHLVYGAVLGGLLSVFITQQF